MFDSDFSKEVVVTQIQAAKSVTGNTAPAGLDISQYQGTLLAIVSFGTTTAGDTNSTLSYLWQSSATNNVSNATNISTTPGSTNTVYTNSAANNAASLATAKIDTRSCLQYLFAVPTIGGANSPAFPVAIMIAGQKAQMS